MNTDLPQPTRTGGRHSAVADSSVALAAAPRTHAESVPVSLPPTNPSVVLWRVVSAGRIVGDFPEQQLLSWVAAGQVGPGDHVWRSGMAAFAPVASVYPFAYYFAPGALPPNLNSLGDDAAMRWLLPVGRSPWAIAAGYLGLFSILVVFAPLAIITGVVAIHQIKRNPDLHGMGRAIFGILAGTVVLLAVAVAALT